MSGEMQRGPNTHRMDAPLDVTTWTVIRTTRNVVNSDGTGMEQRDEWWEVPSFVVAALAAPSTPEPSAPRAKVEQAFEEAMRRNVRSPEEGADSIDATIGSALIDFRSLVLDALRAAPSTEPALDAVEIRATHRYGFRSGEWAVVEGIRWANGRACYRVRFPDARRDSWVVNDPSDPYEFRLAQSHTGYVEIVAKADHPDDPEVMGDAESQP